MKKSESANGINLPFKDFCLWGFGCFRGRQQFSRQQARKTERESSQQCQQFSRRKKISEKLNCCKWKILQHATKKFRNFWLVSSFYRACSTWNCANLDLKSGKRNRKTKLKLKLKLTLECLAGDCRTRIEFASVHQRPHIKLKCCTDFSFHFFVLSSL